MKRARGSACDGFPIELEAGEEFFQAVGVVRFGFGIARDGVEFAACVGDRFRLTAYLDD